MNSYILNFEKIDKTKISLVGGKGANLGELCKLDGITVPEGFCITTEAYKFITKNNEDLKKLLNELSKFRIEDREKISEVSEKIRIVFEGLNISKEILDEIEKNLIEFGENDAYAIRSSATAEDLPIVSFAGQHDTYLNIRGRESILKHIRKCFASLFTERSVIYRIQNGFDHYKVQLAIVIQKMIFPYASGILFTADPITSNRKLLSIDASFGIGEALVSGLVNPDTYKVKDGTIINKSISAKKIEIYPLTNGGTKKQEIDHTIQNKQVLDDDQILELEGISRKIEKQFGCPQDIEWCLSGNEFYIVQSRPITTLFPVPNRNDDEYHVYASVGHLQMMTDPIKPLGLSVWLLTAFKQMYCAGGRLFVDITDNLATPDGRKGLINGLGESDPLTKDALLTIIKRTNPSDEILNSFNKKSIPPIDFKLEQNPTIVTDLIQKSETSIEELIENIKTKKGSELFEFILNDIKKILSTPESMTIIMTAFNASAWVNEKMKEWLCEKNVADTLSQSVSNNITSEMGLALMDVADVIRPYQEVIDYLQNVKEDNFLDGLGKVNGGQNAKEAIDKYLEKYGMRCSGEIDITRTRWSEKPITLVPVILSNIKNFEPNASKSQCHPFKGWFDIRPIRALILAMP